MNFKACSPDKIFQIFNTLQKQNVLFNKNQNYLGSWYICGPTVYDEAHIGHAKTYVQFDIIRRILKMFSYEFVQAMSITDIDDKILRRSKEQNIKPWALAKMHENMFFEDMKYLNVQPPNIKLRVSEHIAYILYYIQVMINKKFAYSVPNGNVYFDSQKYKKNYGKFRNISELKINQSSYEPSFKDPYRKHPTDFALWKVDKIYDQDEYDSKVFDASKMMIHNNNTLTNSSLYGRPGWHIECSVMSNLVFGPRMDIHSGGRDLIFPHHENELAQCSCFYEGGDMRHLEDGKDYEMADIWMHTGHLNNSNDNRKMSKSLKNFMTLKDFFAPLDRSQRHANKIESYNSDHFRMMCLLNHYRKDLTFDLDVTMNKSVSLLNRIDNFLFQSNVYAHTAGQGENHKIFDNHGNMSYCCPIDEVHLEEILAKTILEVDSHLRNDFDTPCVMQALTKLIDEYDKNVNVNSSNPIPSISDIVFYSRSPFVVAKLRYFVENLLLDLGFNFSGMKRHQLTVHETKYETNDSEILSQALTKESSVEILLNFRNNVRSALLDSQQDISLENLKEKLLKHCDSLRQTMTDLGVDIKDARKSGGTWQLRRK
ncbi:probable cysteine--tRNA ligase, mitochondrial isoform X2 [Gordionus sp. m RMFG-2023]|uniref:probable cysteine--tRNA ligase, mitochondrial isoform X2 n=1 Tax=Gordionus sp. m RMFG-2023 TaxID=3053472 RepID=UPI0031FE38CE